ncbi:MAG: Bor family protein [Gemmatimonadales bacterium]
MSSSIRAFGLVSLLLLGGCYHATVETGATPSTVVIDQSFASSWIYGLVPPKLVSTTSKCPSGVSKVETQHTFVNQLVGLLTLGIYTPMQIRVTCATGA